MCGMHKMNAQKAAAPVSLFKTDVRAHSGMLIADVIKIKIIKKLKLHTGRISIWRDQNKVQQGYYRDVR